MSEAVHNESGIFGRSTTTVVRSILRTFNWHAKDVPIETLKRYLVGNPRGLHLINTRKMEELVQCVFREHFCCDVVHCGRTADGGIDLYFVDMDQPVAIQVKRRECSNKTEPVSEVREFLGAMLLSGCRKGIFVSTAHRFTNPAKTAANKSIEIGLTDRFDLVDADRFMDLLRLTYKGEGEPWLDYLHSNFPSLSRIIHV